MPYNDKAHRTTLGWRAIQSAEETHPLTGDSIQLIQAVQARGDIISRLKTGKYAMEDRLTLQEKVRQLNELINKMSRGAMRAILAS